MSKRFTKLREGAGGWTQWVAPTRIHLMGCCDCKLVHRIHFRILDGQIEFRAQRAPRITARRRRGRDVVLSPPSQRAKAKEKRNR